MLTFILTRIKVNPGEFTRHSARFPDHPVAVVVYPTHFRRTTVRARLYNTLRTAYTRAVAFEDVELTVFINAEAPERSGMRTGAG